MQVSVSLLPCHSTITAATDVAVVIDVLRATSVIAAALSAGANRVITCQEVPQARELAASISPSPLLCGERGCKPIDGFDLGNSPAEYSALRVQGKSLVLTTTNGTMAIAATSEARQVITASFLNFSAVAQSLAHHNRITLVCAGTDGQVTGEDVLLAGAIAAYCERHFEARLVGDEAIVARQLWLSWFDSASIPSDTDLSNRLRETQGGRNLIRLGFGDDLDRCAAIDSVAVVPQRVCQNPTTFALQANADDG